MTANQSIAERFWSKVARLTFFECWLWRAGRTTDGYGVFRVHGRTVLAHRWAYEELVGPIPDGLEPDHLCRIRACVNPTHLEPVTHLENVRRGLRGVLTTHCPQGHAYSPDNVRFNRNGSRYCRECKRARAMARRRMQVP